MKLGWVMGNEPKKHSEIWRTVQNFQVLLLDLAMACLALATFAPEERKP